MPTRQTLLALRGLAAGVCLCAAAGTQAQLNFGNMLRSVTGAVAPEQKPQQQQGLTSTMGVRGIDDVQQNQAVAPSGDIGKLDGWASDQDKATKFASTRGLVARAVTLRDTPLPADAINKVEGGQP